MEAQHGRFVGKQRSVDRSVSRYCTYKNISLRLENVGLEAKKHNPVVSLKFSIIECVRESYNQGIIG
jgi:hypothetical protein